MDENSDFQSHADRICPVHGQHDDWGVYLGNVRCARKNCFAHPIAPDVLEAIRAETLEEAADACRAHTWPNGIGKYGVADWLRNLISQEPEGDV